jgi:hypothetical protein
METEYDVDNRDLDTTEITLSNGETIEVRPWELIENAIENFVPEEEEAEKFIKKLNDLKKKIEEKGE